MLIPHTLADVQDMIQNGVEESVHLDYKASAALEVGNDEAAKDVSAFANSDGGVLIYGVRERKITTKTRKGYVEHIVPTSLDEGVDETRITREAIEAKILSTITPHVDDVRIRLFPCSPSHNILVIHIPKSFRGPHQAPDKKYYKRHNFISTPMENYEINDVRERQRQHPSLVTFGVVTRRLCCYFEICNAGQVIAEDVRFDFPQEMPWPIGRQMPHAFAKGISKFSPGQRLQFLYATFPQVFSNASQIPRCFQVTISYYHPAVGSRITDRYHHDFNAYDGATVVSSEAEEQGKAVVTAIDRLTAELKQVNSTLRRLERIAGSTGLDLSIPTLRNLRRVLCGGGAVKDVPGDNLPPETFCQLLGVDWNTAWAIHQAFQGDAVRRDLHDIPGITQDVLELIEETFLVPEEYPVSNAQVKPESTA